MLGTKNSRKFYKRNSKGGSFFKTIFLLGSIVVSCFIFLNYAKSRQLPNHNKKVNHTKKLKTMNILYVTRGDSKLEKCFEEVFASYKNLHKYEILIEQKKIGSTTMTAQPMITFKSLFNGVRKYKITIGMYVKDSNIKVSELPEQVLKGWFAHELGHLSDYEKYSNLEMIVYGLKYKFSASFKREVEYKADYIALEKGYKKEVLATKRYILLGKVFPKKYIKEMIKYYLPIEMVEKYLDKKEEFRLTDIYHN